MCTEKSKLDKLIEEGQQKAREAQEAMDKLKVIVNELVEIYGKKKQANQRAE